MKYASLLLALLLFPASSFAQQDTHKLKLASPISDHMVLQHGKTTSVWGTAKPECSVTVSFGEQSVEATADESGSWQATLQPLEVSAEPASLTVMTSEDESIKVTDILVGEVWMCSGQSNMAWTLKRTGESLEDTDHPNIRLFNTATATAEEPKSDCTGKWEVATEKTASEFSAVGFHFGRELHKELNVPIGLVNTAWGGKPVEAFTSWKKLESVDNAKPLLEEWDDLAASFNENMARARFEASLAEWKTKRDELKAKAKPDAKVKLPRRPKMRINPPRDPNFPGSIYNQNIAPWTRYAIAGSIWYQGESNSGRAVQYESLLTALIEDWRAKWDSDFPFYIVQLANFRKPTTEPGVPDSWAELQHFQTKVAQTMPNCGIAVINEIGETSDIHPKNKKDVGHRLALLALKNHYGKDLEVFASPLYKSHRILDDHIMVTMKNVGAGLKSRDGGELKRFEIAGKNKQWHWAKAEVVSKDSIRVSSDAVPAPAAVRYAWASNPEGANLVNSGDLPASIFRTDDWPLSTAKRFIRGGNTQQTATRMKRQGFTSLLNGKDLTGWRNPYTAGEAKVVGNEVHLTSDKKFFLVTEKKYSDFILFAEIRLPEGPANSGIMFRCHVEPNKVYGYQAECDGSDRCWSAGLYDESRRGWIWPSKKGRTKVDKFLEHEKESQAYFAQPKIRDALKRNGWNRYKITCRYNKISIELNGVIVTDFEDDMDLEGYIGIQHHGEEGQTYRFRNIFIKELEE